MCISGSGSVVSIAGKAVLQRDAIGRDCSELVKHHPYERKEFLLTPQ